MNNTTSEQWTERLAERPGIFPHQLNLVNDRLLLAELSAEEIAAASFLDQRVLKPATRGSWVPWADVAASVRGMSTAKLPSLIFHVGHCGSTLLSRLLAFAEDTQSLREPLPLRTLAQDLADSHDGRSFLDRQQRLERLRILLGLWGRGKRHTVIKATSICSDLLPEIDLLEAGARSVFVYNRPEVHVATLLAGQNAFVDLRGFAQLRLQRLQRATGLDMELSQLSLAQLAVVSWLSESVSIAASLENLAGRVKLLEFESLLQKPAETLANLFTHLDIPADNEVVEKAVQSPVLQTYSKAPEHRYNADTRAAILRDSRVRFQPQIDASLKWLEQLAGQSEPVAKSLQIFS